MFEKINQYVDRYLIQLFCAALLFLSVVAVTWRHIVVQIPVGYAGIIYRPLSDGVDLNKVYTEGIHVVLPWNTITQYDVRILSKELKIEAMTSDLLKSNATLTFQYQVDINTLPLLHKFVGKDYLDKIVIPALLTASRASIGEWPADQAFTSELMTVSKTIASNADRDLIDTISPPGLTAIRFVRIAAAELSGMTFPAEYEKAIDAKLTQSAVAQSYQYKLQAAKSEAERLEIEGEGIRKYQQLIQAGLTDNFLRLKGIQATQALAESNNSKIVVFGTPGTSGLPLVLGDTPTKK
jgi:regulator of protease activity HflC (stomatin/prohibitin superfamily)